MSRLGAALGGTLSATLMAGGVALSLLALPLARYVFPENMYAALVVWLCAILVGPSVAVLGGWLWSRWWSNVIKARYRPRSIEPPIDTP